MNLVKFKKTLDRLVRNRFVLIAIVAGIIILLLSPGGEKKSEKTEPAGLSETDFSLSELESKLEAALAKIEGAGKVKVALTVKTSTEQILAQDRESTERITPDGTETEENVTVVLADKGNDQAPVTLRYVYPEFQGALVIAEGADDAGVRLAITKAVSSLTDLGADRITVAKMQGKN